MEWRKRANNQLVGRKASATSAVGFGVEMVETVWGMFTLISLTQYSISNPLNTMPLVVEHRFDEANPQTQLASYSKISLSLMTKYTPDGTSHEAADIINSGSRGNAARCIDMTNYQAPPRGCKMLVSSGPRVWNDCFLVFPASWLVLLNWRSLRAERAVTLTHRDRASQVAACISVEKFMFPRRTSYLVPGRQPSCRSMLRPWLDEETAGDGGHGKDEGLKY